MANALIASAENRQCRQPNIEPKHSISSLIIMQADIEKALYAKQNNTITTALENKLFENKALESKSSKSNALDASDHSRVIEMAWEDRTPFAAIAHSYGLNEAAVILLMRQSLKPSSFRLWRKRVTGRVTKHHAKRGFMVGRAYCKTQYKPR